MDYSGGWSTFNNHVFRGLRDHFDVSYKGPIHPQVDRVEWLTSKVQRLLHIKSKFFFYSESRLDTIRRKVESEIDKNATCLFFHGITPWIKYSGRLPFYCVTDTTFQTYFDLYVAEKLFSKKDINRIKDQEIDFLNKATGIFFSSRWAMEETKKNYNMKGDNFFVSGIGGGMDGDLAQPSLSQINLLFVSLDFNGKGGLEAFDLFKYLKDSGNKEITLTIIGSRPPDPICNFPGVKYLGRLDKQVPSQLQLFKDTISESTFLIYPTKKDITPHTIIECGYFGTPAIAPSKFGIPEMIKDGESGILLPDDYSKELIEERILFYADNKEIYSELRRRTCCHFKDNFSWTSVIQFIKDKIEKQLEN